MEFSVQNQKVGVPGDISLKNFQNIMDHPFAIFILINALEVRTKLDKKMPNSRIGPLCDIHHCTYYAGVKLKTSGF